MGARREVVPQKHRATAGFNHVEDEFAEILAALDSPLLQDHHGHRAELGEGVVFNAGEQFLSGYMPNAALFLFDERPLGMVEGLADKRIGLAWVARVFKGYNLEGVFEINFLHFRALQVPRPKRTGVLSGKLSQPSR